MIFGVAPADAVVSLSPFRIYNDEITVIGSMAVLHSFGAAVGLLAAGAIETAPLLTHSVPLAGPARRLLDPRLVSMELAREQSGDQSV